MNKFVAKPLEVEAFQFKGKNRAECKQWLADLGVKAEWVIGCTDFTYEESHLLILRGAPKRDLFVPIGNWVLRDEKGLVYTVTNYFFKPRYSIKEQIMSKHPSKKKSKRPPKKRKIV